MDPRRLGGQPLLRNSCNDFLIKPGDAWKSHDFPEREERDPCPALWHQAAVAPAINITQ